MGLANWDKTLSLEVPKMPRGIRLLQLAVALAFSGCAAHTRSERMAAERPDGDYRIGREDVLEVVVWHEPDLSRVVPVRPDGRISLPLAGDVLAAGLTPKDLQVELARVFEPYVRDASVAVVVKEVNASRVFVLGEVAHPGAFPLRGPLSLVQALALAGGRTEFAGGDVEWIRTRQDGTTDRTEVAFDDLVKGSGRSALWLRGGDVLYVP